MRILIVKLSSLGDVIHTLPAAQALRRRFPEAHLAWAVERAHAGILRGTTVVDELIEWDRGTWRGLFDFVRRLRAQPWDLAIDFQGLQRSALITRLSGARRRMGFGPGRERSHWCYNRRVPTAPTSRHAVERSLKLIEELCGVESCGCTPAAKGLFPLPIREPERAAVDAWLKRQHVDLAHERLVVLNPHCRKEANIWPAVMFAELAGRLLAAGLRVAVTGGPVAKSLCDEIAAPHGDRVLRADGAFPLLGSAELIRRAALFVTGDTGPMHIAAAVGAPILALFGPADPSRTGPYSADAVVLSKRLPCGPCFAKHCPLGHAPAKCMTDLTVDEVFAAALARLAPAETLRRTA